MTPVCTLMHASALQPLALAGRAFAGTVRVRTAVVAAVMVAREGRIGEVEQDDQRVKPPVWKLSASLSGMTGPGQQHPRNQQFPGGPSYQGGPRQPGGPQYPGAPQFPGGPQPGAQPFPNGPQPGPEYPGAQAFPGAQPFPGGPQGWQQPPQPKKRSKAPWLISGASALVVIAIVVVLVIANNNKPVPNAATNAANAAASRTTTTAPAKPQPGVPIPCQGDEKFYCVPGITNVPQQVQPGMQAQGYTCGPASVMADAIDHSVNLFCENTTDPKAMRQIKIDFAADDEKATNLVLGKIDVSGMADTWEATDLSQDAWTQEKQGFDTMIAIVLPQAPKVRQDLDAWLTSNAAPCSSGKNVQPGADTEPTAHVDGYIITCQPPSPVSITGDKGTNTNYEGVINLEVNPYAFLDTDTNQPPG